MVALALPPQAGGRRQDLAERQQGQTSPTAWHVAWSEGEMRPEQDMGDLLALK